MIVMVAIVASGPCEQEVLSVLPPCAQLGLKTCSGSLGALAPSVPLRGWGGDPGQAARPRELATAGHPSRAHARWAWPGSRGTLLLLIRPGVLKQQKRVLSQSEGQKFGIGRGLCCALSQDPEEDAAWCRRHSEGVPQPASL